MRIGHALNPKFLACSTSPVVRHFRDALAQNDAGASLTTAQEAEAGMAEMSAKFRSGGCRDGG
jgi:phosphomethylpyrimidine synthase